MQTKGCIVGWRDDRVDRTSIPGQRGIGIEPHHLMESLNDSLPRRCPKIIEQPLSNRDVRSRDAGPVLLDGLVVARLETCKKRSDLVGRHLFSITDRVNQEK